MSTPALIRSHRRKTRRLNRYRQTGATALAGMELIALSQIETELIRRGHPIR